MESNTHLQAKFPGMSLSIRGRVDRDRRMAITGGTQLQRDAGAAWAFEHLIQPNNRRCQDRSACTCARASLVLCVASPALLGSLVLCVASPALLCVASPALSGIARIAFKFYYSSMCSDFSQSRRLHARCCSCTSCSFCSCTSCTSCRFLVPCVLFLCKLQLLGFDCSIIACVGRVCHVCRAQAGYGPDGPLGAATPASSSGAASSGVAPHASTSASSGAAPPAITSASSGAAASSAAPPASTSASSSAAASSAAPPAEETKVSKRSVTFDPNERVAASPDQPVVATPDAEPDSELVVAPKTPVEAPPSFEAVAAATPSQAVAAATPSHLVDLHNDDECSVSFWSCSLDFFKTLHGQRIGFREQVLEASRCVFRSIALGCDSNLPKVVVFFCL